MSEDNWIESLPEPLQSAPFLRAGNDGPKPIEQVVADLTDAAQHMGNSIRIPGADAGDDAMDTFQTRVMERIPGLMKTPNPDDAEGMTAVFGKMGKPEKAEEYKTPEGIELEPEALGQMKAMAHNANMTQGQFNAYLGEWYAANTAASEQHQNTQSEAIAALKGEWGAAYDERTASVAEFLKTNSTTPDSIIQALESGNLPADQVRWLHSLAETVSNEDGQFQQQQNDGNGLVSPLEATEQIEEINSRLVKEARDMTPQMRQSLMVKLLKLQYMRDGERPPSDGELLKVVGG